MSSDKKYTGKLPPHWRENKVGSVYKERITKVSDKDFPPLSVTKKGVVPQLDTVAKTNDNENRKLVKKDDFVINSRSDRRGSCGISKIDGSVSLINTVLEPIDSGKYCNSYYDWFFHTENFADEFFRWGHGIVDDLWTTRWLDMKNIEIPYPPLDEQRRIADFLDDKCAQIDEITEELEEKIVKLEEYKQSLISEKTFNGFSKIGERKNSGIPWVGNLPETWNKLLAKYIFVQRNERGNKNNLELLSPTQNYGVIPQTLYEKLSGMTAVKLNSGVNLNALKTIHKGDYCISLRSFEGGFEYSNYEGVVSPAYQVFYAYKEIDKRYYKYLFKTKEFIAEMNSHTLSIRDGKPISFSDFQNTLLPYPPLEEQKRIADFLDDKCAQIDEITEETRKEIDTLKQYKQSLIYEYVTGKKGVPSNE